jgi:hypothetical protein
MSQATTKSCRALKKWEKSQRETIRFGGTRIQGYGMAVSRDFGLSIFARRPDMLCD